MLQQREGFVGSAPAATGRGSLRRLLVSIGIANAALYALYVGVLQVILAQVEGIDRAHLSAAASPTTSGFRPG
jgi:hypothetical protein